MPHQGLSGHETGFLQPDSEYPCGHSLPHAESAFMRFKTWLWRFMLAMMALVLLLAVAFGVYIRLSFPQLSGEIYATGLQSPVRIERDASDVTHIFAQSETDLAFALGYTHAQERSWQIEFNRRVMHGQLSEVLGAATLETDKLMRTLGIVQAAQAQFEGLPANAKATLQAYADGINQFHATSSQALPPEFHVLRVKPGLWRAQDSVGWALMMALDLGGNWGLEFARLSTAQVLPTERLWDLYPAYPGEPPASKADFAKLYRQWGVFAADQTALPSMPAVTTKTGAINQYSMWAEGLFNPQNLAAEVQTWTRDIGINEGKGSNNWAVAGRHTSSGKPLLANDPHLGLSAPAIWYFARLQVKPGQGGAAQGATLDAIGATLPGLPAIVLGRNAKVAWGFTNTGPDVQDLYLERIKEGDTSHYQTPEGFQAFQTRQETIKVKGLPDVSLTVRGTRHGPVISDVQPQYDSVLNKNLYAIALRWAALDADNHTVLAGIAAPKATSVNELIKAFDTHHSPMQNLVAADVSGQIAFKVIGKLPLRKPENDFRGIAPSPGWDARYDWAGWLPYDQTPSDTGVKGWIATANQRIHAPDYPHFMGQDWATPERFNRIEALLAVKPAQGAKHDPASMQALLADTVSLAAQRLAPAIQAVQSPHPLAAQAQASFAGFDGDMREGSAAPLILAAWADELVRGALVPHLGQEKFMRLYGKRHFRALAEKVAITKDATWCAPKSCEAAAADALTRALERLQTRYGADVSLWRWGTAHQARSVHKPFGNVKPLARHFDVSIDTGGDSWTVNVGQYWLGEAEPFHNRHAASLRHIFDLADLEKSGFIYQTGQSGLVFSSRYRDMSLEWAAVKLRPLRLDTTYSGEPLRLLPR